MAMPSRHWILTSQLLQRQMANLSSLPQFHKISGNTIVDEYWIGIKSLFSPIWTFCKILFRQFVDQLWPSSPNINPRLQEIFKHNRPKLSLYHIENQWIFFKWGTLSVLLPLSKTFHWNIVENPAPRYKYKKHQLIGETGRSDDEYPWCIQSWCWVSIANIIFESEIEEWPVIGYSSRTRQIFGATSRRYLQTILSLSISQYFFQKM